MTTELRIILLSSQPGILTTERLLGNTNLSEWHVIVTTLSEIENSARFHNGSTTPDQVKKITARLDEISAWVEKGGTLLILADTHNGVPINNNGSIRFNAVDTQILENFGAVMKAGRKVSLQTSFPNIKSLENYVPLMTYQNVLTGTGFEVLASVSSVVSGGHTPVSGLYRSGTGQVCISPLIPDNYLAPYAQAFAAIVRQATPNAIDAPGWTRGFKTKSEVTASRSLADLEARLDQVTSEIGSKKREIATEQPLKQLFSATGAIFEDAVHFALEELGFRVARVPGKRTDRLAFADGYLFAVEAKGVDRGISEENSRQVDRWVADVRAALVASEETVADDPHLKDLVGALSELGILRGESASLPECKGMIVVNTYRSVPINERVDPDISNDASLGMSRSGAVALTGLHLFDLVQQAKAKPEIRNELRSSFIDFSGLLQARKWDEFLSAE